MGVDRVFVFQLNDVERMRARSGGFVGRFKYRGAAGAGAALTVIGLQRRVAHLMENGCRAVPPGHWIAYHYQRRHGNRHRTVTDGSIALSAARDGCSHLCDSAEVIGRMQYR